MSVNIRLNLYKMTLLCNISLFSCYCVVILFFNICFLLFLSHFVQVQNQFVRTEQLKKHGFFCLICFSSLYPKALILFCLFILIVNNNINNKLLMSLFSLKEYISHRGIFWSQKWTYMTSWIMTQISVTNFR